MQTHHIDATRLDLWIERSRLIDPSERLEKIGCLLMELIHDNHPDLMDY